MKCRTSPAQCEHRLTVCNFYLQCDGKRLDLASGPSLEGIAILNIPSYAGGTNPWGEVDKKKARKKHKKAKCNGKDDHDWAEQGTAEFLFLRFKYTVHACMQKPYQQCALIEKQ